MKSRVDGWKGKEVEREWEEKETWVSTTNGIVLRLQCVDRSIEISPSTGDLFVWLGAFCYVRVMGAPNIEKWILVVDSPELLSPSELCTCWLLFAYETANMDK